MLEFPLLLHFLVGEFYQSCDSEDEENDDDDDAGKNSKSDAKKEGLVFIYVSEVILLN
ncbi:unnamed protein product [Trifolium pratense]|uniref:Uncharacterized protein n=1 Tax=Trifolium pratense TaxID=57577 RepID=A0ACB0KZX4_TRIPR|nr:unnamed protein product [Trifolium pratense]